MARPPAPPPTARRRHRPLTRSVAFAVASVVTLVGLLSGGLPAQAAPSASELRSEIAKANDQIEQNAEKYNGAKVKLAADQKKSADLAEQIAPMQLQADVAGDQLSQIASHLYMAGPSSTLTVLIDAKSTSVMLDELGALNEMARGQKATIDGAATLIQQYQAKKATQDALVVKDKALVASLAARKKDIQKQLAHLQTLQDQQQAAGGGGGGGGGGGNGSPGGGYSGSGPYTKAELMPHPCPYGSGSGKGEIAAEKACSLVWTAGNNPPWRMYHWGSAGPDTYDCSGLTMTAWKAAGVTLAHYTGGQWSETAPPSGGSRPTRSTLEVGDLVFYYSDHHHVAIYIGNGWIVQAEETGQPLKESQIGSPSGYGRPR